MTTLSAVMLLQLRDPSTALLGGFGDAFRWLAPPHGRTPLAFWTQVPFIFTIFGAGVGALFELYLLIDGTAFQQTRSKGTTFVLKIRLLNLAPVTGSILFFIVCMMVPDPSLRAAMLLASGFTCFSLGAALFFGGGEKVVPLILIGLQVLGAVIILLSPSAVGGPHVKYFLLAQPVLQTIAFLVTTATPLKSTGFHVISTLSGVVLYLAVVVQTAADASFSHSVALDLSPGTLLLWLFVGACLVGLVFTFNASHAAFNNYRSAASEAFWSLQYFLLVSAPRFPKPVNLSEVYKDRPAPTKLRPYYIQHPEFLKESLSVPAVEKLEANVLAFQDLVQKARKTFAVIAVADHIFPQANSNLPLANKPRLEIWSSGANYWPGIFKKKLFGLSLPNPNPEVAPDSVIEAYKQGQELALLCESGVAATMLAPGRTDGELVLDLRFLEGYENKPDYERYGGRAFFVINQTKKCLELVSVIAPGTDLEIKADPRDATYRRAESMIIASTYYHVVSGKHLLEIHMAYNLVEVALHNAFDAQGQWTHPVRTFMYLHLFSHELAEELTTEHLVQEGAVFTQVFATTHDALIDHLNDGYQAFEYGKDEDFEGRAKMFSLKAADGKSELLPKSAIRWELEYAKIWQRYCDALIDIIYEDDAAVVADRYIHDLHQELQVVLVQGLPGRYDALKSKAGLSRFCSDTIHHLVIRHQVYGTTGVPGLDPRVATTQIPRDGGPPGVDEWRSLACVALATAHARFTLLLGDFKYLLDGVDPRFKDDMGGVFDKLQEDLHVLDAQWNATTSDKEYNRNYFRAVPSDLHTGAGY